MEDDDKGPYFSMGMTQEEKKEARKPWKPSLVIKLVRGKYRISVSTEKIADDVVTLKQLLFY